MGIGPYGSITRGAVGRADVGIGPYGSITRGAAKRAVEDAGPYGRLQVVRWGGPMWASTPTEALQEGAVRGRIPQSRLRRASPL